MADIAASVTIAGGTASISPAFVSNPFSAHVSGGASSVLMGEPTYSVSMPPFIIGSGQPAFVDAFFPIRYYSEPLSGAPQARIDVVDRFGNRFGTLENAEIGEPTMKLNESGEFSFTLSATDPKIGLCKVATREVQVWRGSRLEGWYTILKARGNADSVQFDCKEPDWFLGLRRIGLAPMPNLLRNGSFDLGERYWNFSWVPGSIPTAPPVHRLHSDTLNGPRSLYIEGSDAVQVTKSTLSGDVAFAFDSSALTRSGKYALDALIKKIKVPNPTMTIEGHTDSVGDSGYNYTLGLGRAQSVRSYILSKKPNANITAVSYGENRPIATNSTAAGRAKNRRVDIDYTFLQTAKGHKQYAGQSFTVTNPVSSKKRKALTLVGWTKILQYDGRSKDGFGVYMQLVDPSKPQKPVKSTGVPINDETPRNRWTRMECSLNIPADGKTYRVDVRLYPPEGKSLWDEISVTLAEQLAFFDVDQALIIKGLVEHAQDPAMGKDDLNIGTRTPVTRKKRTREYPWIERMPVIDAINEFLTLAGGVDVSMDYTPTTRTLRTHFPRQGKDRGYTFALGSNVVDFEVDIDGEQMASRVIVQAEGEGSDREEGVYFDASKMDNLVMETVYNATPGSAISSLKAQALRGWKRYGRPLIIPSVTMDPAFTDELLNRANIGDVVNVRIKHGWIDIDQKYRITERKWVPADDHLVYTITPEDVK